jgi:hypothetical protein
MLHFTDFCFVGQNPGIPVMAFVMFVMASLSLKTNKTQTHTQLGDAVQVSLAEQAACLQE